MPETEEEERFFTKPLAVIFVTVMIDLIGFGIVIPVLPYYVERPEFGATPLQLGLIVASYSVMQFIFSPVMGGLSDKYGRRPILFWSLLGTAAGFFIVVFCIYAYKERICGSLHICYQSRFAVSNLYRFS